MTKGTRTSLLQVYTLYLNLLIWLVAGIHHIIGSHLHENDVYLAYLPLAHILELLSNHFVIQIL